ncbi:MAG: hypothetical protein F6K10_24560, partial [Moorea sp. SIO2B7]|nr:hypothetical protein [Moorena sp. SIO2B7]
GSASGKRNRFWLTSGVVCLFLATTVVVGTTAFSAHTQDKASQEAKAKLTKVANLLKRGAYQECQEEAQELREDSPLFEDIQKLGYDCQQLSFAQQLASDGQFKDAIKALMRINFDSIAASDAWHKIAQWSNVSLGEPTKEVINRLGKPTGMERNPSDWTKIWQSLGVDVDPSRWITRKQIYELVPGEITLEILLDCPVLGKGEVHQTDFILAQSVDLSLMEAKLSWILGGNISESIKHGIEQVYHHQANRYGFNTTQFNGVIERDDSNQIRLAIREREIDN